MKLKLRKQKTVEEVESDVLEMINDATKKHQGRMKKLETMSLDEAIHILEIMKLDYKGKARDLSYNPTNEEIAKAIEIILDRINH